MKLHTTLFFLGSMLVFATSGHAQNLAVNGSFELVSGAPTGQGQLSLSNRWSNCNGQTGYPYATPDLFTFGGSGGAQWPNSFAGTITPQAGDVLAGFITSNFFLSDFREYCSYRLDAALTPGQTYTVSFWLSNGTGNWYGNRGSNNIGVGFTTSAPVQAQHEPLPIVPQVEITTIVHHTYWQQYSFTFTAAQPYAWMTIGNFRNDASTSFATFTSGNPLAYYFLDDVRVVATAPLAAEQWKVEQTASDEAMQLHWRVPSDAIGERVHLERSQDQQSYVKVAELGEITASSHEMQFADAQAVPGITYFYRLGVVTPNGELQYSPVLVAQFGKAVSYVAGKVFPNPVQDHFSLEFATANEGELDLGLFDAAGRVVFQEPISIVPGQSAVRYELPNRLPPGIYQAHFSFAGHSFTKKIVVAEGN